MSKYYTFERSGEVTRKTVFYNNRYGIRCAADLYLPKNMDKNKKHPAAVIGPPYAGTKEQGPGVYANQMAQRGFVCLAFDPVYMGESGGKPRHVSSPDLFAEGFSAGVDYIGCLDFVDRKKIAAVGICGSGGFALSAAQVDVRIQAVVTASMFDISQAVRQETPKQIAELKKQLAAKRWEDFEKGTAEWIPAFPAEPAKKVPEGLDPISAEFFEYYGLKRGHHPNALGNFTTTSQLAMLQFPLLAHIKEISPRPILMIIGDQALTNIFTETAFANAGEPKKLVRVPDANHIDLYDDVTKIPFDTIEAFLNQAFA